MGSAIPRPGNPEIDRVTFDRRLRPHIGRRDRLIDRELLDHFASLE